MYINPIAVGVLGTLIVEAIALGIWVWYYNSRR